MLVGHALSSTWYPHVPPHCVPGIEKTVPMPPGRWYGNGSKDGTGGSGQPAQDGGIGGPGLTLCTKSHHDGFESPPGRCWRGSGRWCGRGADAAPVVVDVPWGVGACRLPFPLDARVHALTASSSVLDAASTCSNVPFPSEDSLAAASIRVERSCRVASSATLPPTRTQQPSGRVDPLRQRVARVLEIARVLGRVDVPHVTRDPGTQTGDLIQTFRGFRSGRPCVRPSARRA